MSHGVGPAAPLASAIGTWERRGLEAWPAQEAVEHEGWLLRFAAGYTRRANSVHPFDWKGANPDEAIAHCEAEYRARGLRPVFKLTQAALPLDLDERLAARGYALADPTAVKHLDLAELPRGAGTDVLIEAGVGAPWLDACMRINGLAPPLARPLRDIVARMRGVLAARIEVEGAIAAQCLGVVVEGQLSVCLVGTDPARRRNGLARRALGALLARARELGANAAWLAVERDNAPAVALYDAFGFADLYGYWYRQLEA